MLQSRTPLRPPPGPPPRATPPPQGPRQRRAVPTMLSPLTPSRGNPPERSVPDEVEDLVSRSRAARSAALASLPQAPPRSTAVARSAGGGLIPMPPRAPMTSPGVLPTPPPGAAGTQRHTLVRQEAPKTKVRQAPAGSVREGNQERLLAEILNLLKAQGAGSGQREVDVSRLPELYHVAKASAAMNRMRS